MPLPTQPPAPSWVELGALPNRGLDLTGLRLPVQAIGNELLDGITTITPSVRYVSFYSWIVLSYLSARRPDNWQSFREFAEQVETAIALGNILWDSQVVGLVGFRGASRLVNEEIDPAPLQILVEQSAANIYLNPSQQLKFTLPATIQVPGLSTQRGKPLAEFVSNAFSKTRLGALFSQAQLLPEATRDELREFGEAAHLTKMSDEEADLLIAGILPTETRTDQETRRVGTYACVLGLADLHSRLPSENDFFEDVQRVKRELPEQLHSHLNGWLRYSVRDVLAVAHEYLLQELIQTLAALSPGRSVIPSNEVLTTLIGNIGEHSAALQSYGLLNQGENPYDLEFADLYDRIDTITSRDRIVEEGMTRWNGSISELALIESIQSSPSSALVLLPVVWCVATLRTALWPEPEGNPFEGRRGIGWNAIGVHEVVVPAVRKFVAEGWRLGQVMSELALRTIDQHLRVSWSRMAVDTRHDVALLVADGGRWQSRSEQKHAQDYRAGRTASRLSQVVNWLKQLRLMDDSGLTPRGKTVYQLCLKTVSGEVRYDAA